MEFAEILKNYQELKKLLDDGWNYVCFDTKNGRRMIVKIDSLRKCVSINSNFRICSFKDEDKWMFYDNPLELLESYFTHGDVRIDDILITKDKIEALAYLQETKQA